VQAVQVLVLWLEAVKALRLAVPQGRSVVR
jgi:hypothetical protein